MFCDSDDKRWTHALYKYVYECCLTNIPSHCLAVANYEKKNGKFTLWTSTVWHTALTKKPNFKIGFP